ncbi:MAG TPA: inositol monophosphatase family protein [Dehalococcoidia bacterium]|nr:inositol monophosphatase family protein [Dehalococcoidia bacterium]
MLELPPSRSGRPPLQIASQVARAAGGILLSSFSRTDKKTRPKGKSNLVTEADYLSEQAILGELRAEFPSCGFLSEESEAVVSDSPFTWVVDPMDGSNNFSFGVPFFSVNLALLCKEEVVLGVTYDPVRDELFYGLKGQGAFLGEKPLRVSARTELKDALVGFDMGYDMERGREMLEAARKLWGAVFSFRIMGSAALVLAYVASGRLDLYLHRRLYPWDILPGKLLIEEAGGVVSDWEGNPALPKTQAIIAGNPELHRGCLQKVGTTVRSGP